MANWFKNPFRIDSKQVFYPLGFTGHEVIGSIDVSFKANGVGSKYIKLANEVEIVDTILIYLANWFSKGIPYEETPSGEKIYESELIDLINKPNAFQGKEEFMAEMFYFLLAAGTHYIYPLNSSLGFEGRIEGTSLLNLNFDNVEEPEICPSIFDFTGDLPLKYVEDRGNGDLTPKDFNFNEVIPFYDSINGTSGLYKGKSRLESIKDEIKNIYLATKAKQNKLDLSGITLVTPEDTTNNSMSKGLDTPIPGAKNKDGSYITQKDALEAKFSSSGLSKGRSILLSSKQLKALNLTEALEKVNFDPMRIEDARTIKRKYGIPENILALTDRSEKEKNLESETLTLIQTAIEPKADNFGASLASWFGIPNKLKFDYSHVPAYSAVNKQKTESDRNTAQMINELVKTQVLSPQEARAKLEELGIL